MAKEIIEAEIKSNIGEVADGIDKAAKNTEKLDEATKKGAKGFLVFSFKVYYSGFKFIKESY